MTAETMATPSTATAQIAWALRMMEMEVIEAEIEGFTTGALAAKFMHAVDEAELTLSHEAHRDTEYRYTITGDDHLTALVKIDSDTWDTLF
ncbi:hypothetical protein MBAV_000781, partial [Candidatus Magnetobacterium bavaricum]